MVPLRASSRTRRGRRHRNSAALAASTKGSSSLRASAALLGDANEASVFELLATSSGQLLEPNLQILRNLLPLSSQSHRKCDLLWICLMLDTWVAGDARSEWKRGMGIAEWLMAMGQRNGLRPVGSVALGEFVFVGVSRSRGLVRSGRESLAGQLVSSPGATKIRSFAFFPLIAWAGDREPTRVRVGGDCRRDKARSRPVGLAAARNISEPRIQSRSATLFVLLGVGAPPINMLATFPADDAQKIQRRFSEWGIVGAKRRTNPRICERAPICLWSTMATPIRPLATAQSLPADRAVHRVW
jgi:hypothetical protein